MSGNKRDESYGILYTIPCIVAALGSLILLLACTNESKDTKIFLSSQQYVIDCEYENEITVRYRQEEMNNVIHAFDTTKNPLFLTNERTVSLFNYEDLYSVYYIEYTDTNLTCSDEYDIYINNILQVPYYASNNISIYLNYFSPGEYNINIVSSDEIKTIYISEAYEKYEVPENAELITLTDKSFEYKKYDKLYKNKFEKNCKVVIDFEEPLPEKTEFRIETYRFYSQSFFIGLIFILLIALLICCGLIKNNPNY